MKKPKVKANTVPELLTGEGIKDLIDNFCRDEMADTETLILIWRGADDNIKLATTEYDPAMVAGILEGAKIKVLLGNIVSDEEIDLIDPDEEEE